MRFNYLRGLGQSSKRILLYRIVVTLCLLTMESVFVQPQTLPAGPALESLFRASLPVADVAVMLDASLSMPKPQYHEVRQAIIDFPPMLTGREVMHLRVFGDVAGAPLEGVAGKIAGNVADHLPAEPIFHNTDLGAAISKAIEFLERPGANEIQAIFLLTDGLHQPPLGSPFSRDFDGDADWRDLRLRARELCERRQVLVYGFGLGAQTDISLLLKVFPVANVEVVTGNATLLAATLQQMRERLRLTGLRQAVEQDLRAGSVEVRFAPGAASGESASFKPAVTIRNAHRFLPIAIDRIELGREPEPGGETDCAIENAPSSLTLAPGGEWQGRLQCGFQSTSPRWRIGRHERIAESNWRITFNARFSDEAEIARLITAPAVPRPPKLDAPPLRVELRDRHGVPYWMIGLFLLTVSSLMIFRQRQRNQLAKQRAVTQQRQAERMRLSGTIKIWPKDQREPHVEGVDLSRYKRPQLHLLLNADGALEIVLPDAESANVVARLSGHLPGAQPNSAEAGKVEFRLEAPRGHRLAYEAGGEWREVTRLTLCDRDLIEIDGCWCARYANHRLRTRAEVESARM